mmetsp:Transcript_32049/g.80429  ORF Transcript_32049/g.80429 Transcript_32049/m.80429 type:complete len:331 (-) Transcript_32049:242-1234(-)
MSSMLQLSRFFLKNPVDLQLQSGSIPISLEGPPLPAMSVDTVLLKMPRTREPLSFVPGFDDDFRRGGWQAWFSSKEHVWETPRILAQNVARTLDSLESSGMASGSQAAIMSSRACEYRTRRGSRAVGKPNVSGCDRAGRRKWWMVRMATGVSGFAWGKRAANALLTQCRTRCNSGGKRRARTRAWRAMEAIASLVREDSAGAFFPRVSKNRLRNFSENSLVNSVQERRRLASGSLKTSLDSFVFSKSSVKASHKLNIDHSTSFSVDNLLANDNISAACSVEGNSCKSEKTCPQSRFGNYEAKKWCDGRNNRGRAVSKQQVCVTQPRKLPL